MPKSVDSWKLRVVDLLQQAAELRGRAEAAESRIRALEAAVVNLTRRVSDISTAQARWAGRRWWRRFLGLGPAKRRGR